MELKEFREKINIAESNICSRYSLGVCNGLTNAFNRGQNYNTCTVCKDFKNYLKPKHSRTSVFWLGEIGYVNKYKRLYYLRMFERIVIDEKLYLNY